MIDLWGVLANGLWVLGLASVLGVLSWGYWAAGEEKARLRAVLGRPGLLPVLDLGLALFSTGIAVTSRAWWERVLWGLLAVVFSVQAWLSGRRNEQAGKSSADADPPEGH